MECNMMFKKSSTQSDSEEWKQTFYLVKGVGNIQK